MKTTDPSRTLARLPWLPALLAAVWLLLPGTAARAQTPAPSAPDSVNPGAADQRLDDAVRQFHPQQGQVALPDGLATLKVPADFCYLNPEDSRKVIVDLWGNPPTAAEGVLGMLMPAKQGQPDVRDWGVVMTFEKEGYVQDTDADKINYNDLLKKMQESMLAGNEKRREAGYKNMELVGWAATPRYDKQSKKLYWAKELQIGDNPVHTLNYDVRILGRRGVLSLNAVAGMDQLREIEQATPQILGMVDFNQGHRYADFDPKTDKVAEYGLAALVAGGILAKVGGFKLLLAGLLAAKKFVIIGLVAVGSFFKKIFGGGGVKTHQTPSTPSDTGVS